MALKSSAFLETIIAFLLPYFTVAAQDADDARNEILDTLASYATRTRAELLLAAQVIAFGMATLDALAEARTADMSLSMRLRLRGCANGINRSANRTEKALGQRLAGDPPACPEPVPEPLSDIPDAEIPDAFAQARAALETHRCRLADARPAADPASRIERNKQQWAGAMMDTLQQMGYKVQAVPGG